ncbi:uncharacterized protein LOC112507306 [Cynara cardunculus var. scolymus]|uniref:Uncharacterized protein n=1 Tax=Cynara cardunculus var. scolymus TaxID=59895 RepID=A0A103YEL1_CYNCS|nr:uncharacterized protein LOC112507306 [Cynara cardunculus var. scolymus]KVI07641.1 Protein of unknown function DUF4228 [Cynara cardunculus var. scolymus]
MGGCFSSPDHQSVVSNTNSALVISPTGELRPYSTPVFVSDVLQSHPSFFLCNSDNLSYDQLITPLDAHDELDAAQIYFLVPISKLHHRLTASEMAALAVKASLALNTTNISLSRTPSSSTSSKPTPTTHKRKSKSKISPFVVMETSKINVIVDQSKRLVETTTAKQQIGVSRSGSIRRIQRYSSRKARLAVRSFRLRLSTIYESESSDQSQSHKYY